MKIPIPFCSVGERWPESLDLFSRNLKGGKSKDRYRSISDAEFSLEWTLSLPVFVLSDVVGGRGDFTDPITKMVNYGAVEISCADARQVLEGRISWILVAKIGRWRGSFRPEFSTVPDEIIEFHRSWMQASMDRRIALRALTPEERRRRDEAALAILRGHLGLVEVDIDNA